MPCQQIVYTSETVLIVVLLTLELCYLLLGLSTDILYFVPEVFKFIFKLLPWVIRIATIVLLTHCSDSLVDYQCSGLFSNRDDDAFFNRRMDEFTY